VNAVGDGKNSITINYSKLVGKIMDNKRHKKFVEKTMLAFENSGNWANEAVKIVSIKEN
jgi:hypothetical protein